MYLVELKNGDKITRIHGVKQKLTSGKVVKGINAIDTFTFTVPPSNIGFDHLHDFTTLVTVYNTIKKRYEFQGRVLYSDVSMEESGLIEKNVTCESYFGFLCDTVQPYIEEKNWGVRELFEFIINQHNSQIEDYKKFTIGKITVTDPNDNLYVGIQRENTWETLTKKLIEILGGEIRFRVENGVNYIDYLTQIGEVKSTPIKMARNMKAINKETDPTAYVTRLIPLGAKLNDDSEERLDISSVNDGKNYIEDSDAIKAYGVHAAYVEFDDITVAANLLRQARAWFTNSNKIKIKYSITALDLSLLGLDIDDFEVYNYHPVDNPLLGIDDVARIIKTNTDICDDLKSSFEIGEKFYTLTELQNQSTKKSSNTKSNQDKRISDIEKRVMQLESNAGGTSHVYNIKVGESFDIAYEGNSPTVGCPHCLTYYDDGGLLVFTGVSEGKGTIYINDSDTLIGKYVVNVIDPSVKIYDYTIKVGESFDLAYEGSSPSVECPNYLTYYDDGGLLVFLGTHVGTGTIYINDSDTLIGKYTVKVIEAVTYDYDLKLDDTFQIPYHGNSPTVECPYCLNYYDDGGLLVFTAISMGVGTIYLHDSDTLLAKYSVRVVASESHVHTYATLDRVITNATCTTAGSGIYKCTCGEEVTKTLPKLGHSWGSPYYSDEFSSGYGRKCNTCGEKQELSYEKCDHPASAYSETVIIDPTCTAAGSKTCTCDACRESWSESIAALGHSWGSPYYSSEFSSGYGRKCQRSGCGALEELAYVECEHPESAYSESVIVNPTCTVKGSKTCTCDVCRQSWSEDIPALGHDWHYYEDSSVSSGWSRECLRCHEIEEDIPYDE